MEEMLLLLSPVAVSLVTSLAKKVNLRKYLTDIQRRGITRAVVALLSFVAVWLSSALAGTDVPTEAIESFANAALVFFSSTGLYFFVKKR